MITIKLVTEIDKLKKFLKEAQRKIQVSSWGGEKETTQESLANPLMTDIQPNVLLKSRMLMFFVQQNVSLALRPDCSLTE
jgi:hypothetical protein